MKTNRLHLIISWAVLLILHSISSTASAQVCVQAVGDRNLYIHGGIVRTDTTQKTICLLFTAHDYADGTEPILAHLKRAHIQASFFFTGKFMTAFPKQVKRIQAEGHYVGSHGFEHLLYCDWTNRDSTLISKQDFIKDLTQSYQTMAAWGIRKEDAPFFEPPFEWYNTEVATWAKEFGLQIIQFTGGNYSNADYTTPDMKSYKSSQEILERILAVERTQSLNGALLLFHLGTSPLRTDKFYARNLSTLIDLLQHKGYVFTTLQQAIKPVVSVHINQ